MSLTLILMRHAKSAWGDPTLDDFDRPLNGRGRAAAVAMGVWLRDCGYVPDAIVSSSSTRTGQTCAQLGFSVAPIYLRALYHARADAMLDVLRTQTAACVLMLGHNPGVADLAQRLVHRAPDHPRFGDHPTGAVTVMRFDVGGWKDIGWYTGQPMDFAIPREVMA